MPRARSRSTPDSGWGLLGCSLLWSSLVLLSVAASPTAAVVGAGGAAEAEAAGGASFGCCLVTDGGGLPCALAHSIPWHNSGRSRLKSAWWKAPASGPRLIWRNPHRFSLRVNDGYFAAVGRRSIRARFRLDVEVAVAVDASAEVEAVEEAAEVPGVLVLVEALSGK